MPAVPRSIWSFLLLAYGISWSIVGVGYALGVQHAAGLGYVVVAALCMLGPASAAIIQQKLIDRAPWSGLGLQVVGMRWKYVGLTALIGVLIIPLALLAVAVGQGLGIEAFGQVEVTQQHLLDTIGGMLATNGVQDSSKLLGLLKGVELSGAVLLLTLQLIAVLAACSANLPMMLGEELGWRGYLYNTTRNWGMAPRVLFAGTVWGLWHAPLILMGHNYPHHPWLGVPLMVVFCVLLALLFDWSRTRTRAVWGPCVLHGIINGSAGGYILFAWGGHSLFNSPVGASCFVALGALGLLVLVFDKEYRQGRLGLDAAVAGKTVQEGHH